MSRIAKLDLHEVNKQFDRIDQLEKIIKTLQVQSAGVGYQTSQLDYFHAPQTTNNLVFTWTGTSVPPTLTWTAGFIQDKNAAASTHQFSGAAGQPHNFPVTAGSISNLAASTYYWLGWNSKHGQMIATTDAGHLFQNKDVHVVCQLFTGTIVQTGTAGGGGSQGGVDLSGARYKLF